MALIKGKQIGAGEITASNIAADTITANEIAATTITAAEIANNTITATQIAVDTITASEIAPDAVTSSELADNSVDTNAIQGSAVTEAKIGAGAVTNTKLGADAVDDTKLADNAVGSEHIQANAVGTSEIDANAVTSTEIAANAVTATELDTNAVTTVKILDANVTGAKIAADAIDGSKIADDVLESEHYAASSIDGEHLSADAKSNVLDSRNFGLLVRVDEFTASSSTTDDVTDEVVTAATSSTVDGSITTDGIVTTAPNNSVYIRQDGTNDQLKDASDRTVFGRLTSADTALTGTLTFTNGNTAVSATGGAFTTELAVGDYIKLDADGVLSKVQTITDNDNLTLAAAYTGTGGTGAGSKVDITLSYLVDIAGTETAHTMSGELIDFNFVESQSLNDAPLNAFVSGFGFTDTLAEDHTHDDRYFTETELGSTSGTSGADLIGLDNTGMDIVTTATVEGAVDELDAQVKTNTDDIAALGTVPVVHQEFINEAVNKGNNFATSLSVAPIDVTDVQLAVNGSIQRNGAGHDFTVSGTTISWLASADFDIAASDDVAVRYEAAS